MLSDRPYMRDNYGRPSVSPLIWLICGLAAAFVLENVVIHWFGGQIQEHFFDYLTLSHAEISRGFVWTLLTHGLLHDPNSLLHLAFILLTIYFFGRSVISEIGDRHFLGLFAGAVALGGLTWLVINWIQPGAQLFGASAGVSALIVVSAFLSPQQPITLFFVDVGLKMKHLALGLLVIDALGLVLLEIPGRGSWFSMAHSAHLGGMLAGWLYFQFVHQRGVGPLFNHRPSIELPRWFRKTRKTDPAPVYRVNVGPDPDPRAEIDRILDKINSDGFQSLTADEKHRLDRARDHLSRR